MRCAQTPAELTLWKQLRNRQLHGLKFLRQHPFFVNDGDNQGFFVADFYCFEHKLVVEVDGPIHESKRKDDENRSLVLARNGVRVIRVGNLEVETDLNAVLERIAAAANSPPDPLSWNSWKERGNQKMK